MQALQVIVNKLNKRKSPVADFSDKSNVVDVVAKNFTFESDGSITNGLGKWYKDKDGYYYSEIGLQLINHRTSPPTIRPFLKKVIKEMQPWFSDLLKIPTIWNTYNTFGENVVTAVLDTGYDAANTDISPNIIKSEKLITYGNHTEDIDGHGTRCAALICCTNHRQRNIGIAPQTKVIAGKISNKGETDSFQIIIDGIEWAIQNNAEIISLSYGVGLSDSVTIEHFYQSISDLIREKEVLIFVCCGNNYDSSPSQGIRYPAAFSGKNENINIPPLEKIISVGATNNDNELDPITLLNDYTILHSPGRDIISYQLNSVADPDSGTSMSTPIVAGVCALAASYIKKKNGSWNALALKKMIYDTADSIRDDPSRKIINPVALFKMLK